jgi:tetratricopeptide (TPR) repeat protein
MSVRAWEDQLVLKTYVLGPEDPLPHWERTGTSRIYPYPMQDDLGEEAREVAYRALHLENEYLHVIVLPELGGHLYSLYDKVAKREVFYRNNVAKFGLVARRGAWISGGIEFNFPQGHTCVTVSPVSSAIVEDAATGVASIHVGTIDRVSRMRWSVKLSMAPGEARLRQDVMLHNPTPFRQRHYFWANSAVPARDDLHLVYPARKCRTIGGEHPYPIQNGRDMSWYKNHERPNDIFALDVTEDFFGCYYEQQDAGLVHWSDHREDFGKKFFTWGTADEGMIWVDLLTDDDGQYVELQSGRFVDQSTFEFLRPYQCVRWGEYWYPLHGMGGFCWANHMAAIDLRLDGNTARIAALANVPLGEADLVLEVDDEEVWRSTHTLMPGRPVQEELSLLFAPGEGSVVALSVAAGEDEVIRYEHPPEYLRDEQPRFPSADEWEAEGEFTEEDVEAMAERIARLAVKTARVELPKAQLRPADDPEVTAEELWRHGLQAEKVDDWPRAREHYARALMKDAGFSGAHVGLGVIELRQGATEEAIGHLRQAVARDPDCDEAWYYLGIAYWQSGEFPTAEDIWGRLVGHTACRTEAALELTQSLEPGLVRDLLSDLPDSPTSRFLWVWTYRAEGAPAPDVRSVFHEQDPLSAGLVAEEYLGALEEDDEAVMDEAWARLCELLQDDPESWLELAFHYQRLADPEDSWELISRAANELPAVRRSPMVFYFLALAADLGHEFDAEEAVKDTRPEYCFPSRLEEWSLLNLACSANPGNWKARLYLGNLFAWLGRRDEALECWEEAAQIEDGDAILCRNLGLAHHLWKSDHQAALDWYAKAVRARPEEYRLYLERDNVLRASGAEARTRLEGLDVAPPKVLDRWEMAARRAECLINLGRWDEALELMQTHTFRPWEGARQMHALWTRALTGRAAEREQAGDYVAALADYELALTYPRNLGVGRAAHPQEAKVRWLAAECAGQVGEEERRRAFLESAADERHDRTCEADLYRLKALQALGRSEEAAALAQQLQAWAAERFRTHPDDALSKRIRDEVG